MAKLWGGVATTSACPQSCRTLHPPEVLPGAVPLHPGDTVGSFESVCSWSVSGTQPTTATCFGGKPEGNWLPEPGEGVTRPSGGPSCGNGVRGAALKHGSRKTLMPACNIHSAFDSKAGIVLNSLNISWVAPRRDFGEGFLRCHHIPTLPRSLSCPVWKKSDDTLSCSQRVLQK